MLRPAACSTGRISMNSVSALRVGDPPPV